METINPKAIFMAMILTILLGFVVDTTNANSHLPNCKANAGCLLELWKKWETVTAADMQAMIDAGADVNAVNARDSNTPLHHAVEAENAEVIPVLVKAGADVNAKEYYSNTPLHLAAMFGKIKVIPILLKAGADVNAKDVDGRTPLEMAKASSYPNAVTALKGGVVATKNPEQEHQAKEQQAASNNDYFYCQVGAERITDGRAELIHYYSDVFIGDRRGSGISEINDFQDYVEEQLPDGFYIDVKNPGICNAVDTAEEAERGIEFDIRVTKDTFARNSLTPPKVVRTGWSAESEIPLQDFNITVPASDQELEICVRDYACIDGDEISVTLDGSRIFSGELYGNWDCQRVGTSAGRHLMELYAINDTGGKGGCPNMVNTGEIRIEGKNSQTQSWRHGGRRGSSVNVIVEVK